MGQSYITTAIYVAVAVFSMVAGIFTAQWLQNQDDKTSQIPNSTSQIGVPEIRPNFTLRNLEGKEKSLSDWDGKVILLNFWATWCPPCRKEMPDFIALRETLANQPFEIIGVAIDRPEPVQDFIDEIGVEYPILLAELEGLKIMKEYGNNLTTLPYTVVIDQQKRIVKAFRTEVSKQQILAVVQPILDKPAVASIR